MNAAYIHALEKRAQWLKWIEYEQKYQQHLNPEDDLYKINLKYADMFFMNDKFCDLVNHARLSVPDDLRFDLSWPPTKMGFMWLEKPFRCPTWILDEEYKKEIEESLEGLPPEAVAEKMARVLEIQIHAIGWVAAERTYDLDDGRRYAETYSKSMLPPAIPSAYSFLCFFDLGDHFEKWAYFTFSEHDTIAEKVKKFEELAEKQGGRYHPLDMKYHEIRWIYTAMHLMSQKLSIQVDHETDRATKRRADREKKTVVPKFKVVTLRRMEVDRKAANLSTEREKIDWQWQWTVRGHWRNQWYPAEKVHKQVFVEAYLKGPDDKPLKEVSQKIFVAKR